jgi:hypothetical protein
VVLLDQQVLLELIMVAVVVPMVAVAVVTVTGETLVQLKQVVALEEVGL